MSQDPEVNCNHYISTIGVSWWCTLGIPVHIVKWPFSHMVLWGYVTNQTFYISTCIWAMVNRHGEAITYHDGLPPINSYIPLSKRSPKVTWHIKTLYLHYHNVYGHQTCQSGNTTWGAFTYKVIWPLYEVVLWDHVSK